MMKIYTWICNRNESLDFTEIGRQWKYTFLGKFIKKDPHK